MSQAISEGVELWICEREAIYLKFLSLWVVIFDLPQNPLWAVLRVFRALLVVERAALCEVALLRKPLGVCDGPNKPERAS